jgi:hypothetical protein
MKPVHNVKAPVAPDFLFADHGSICILTPTSANGINWINEHLPEDSPRWCGGTVIEHRYVNDILGGITDDGLVVA